MLDPIRWRSGRQHPTPPSPAPHRFDTTNIPERVTMRPKLMVRDALKSIDLKGFRMAMQRRKRLRFQGTARTVPSRTCTSNFDIEGSRWMSRGAKLEVTIYGRGADVRYAPYRESPDVPIGHVRMTHPKMGVTFPVVRSVDLHWLLRQHRQLVSVSSDQVRGERVVLERVCRLP